MLGLLKRKQKNTVSDLQYEMAQTPQVVNPKAVEGYVRPVIESYILALYSQESSLLPGRKMRENFLSSAEESIGEDRKMCQRTCTFAKVLSLRASDYDQTKIFAFRGIEFSCLYSVRGTFNGKLFEEKRKALFSFLNDQRQGWVLDDWRDLGRASDG